MAQVNRADLATIVLTTSITAAATTITVPNADAAVLPSTPFYATIMPASEVANKNNSEILYFVSSTVSGGNTTYQVTRAQKGTTAKAWESGAIVANAIYLGDLDAVPVNSIVDYDGDDVPDGWEEVADGGVVWNTLTISTAHSNGSVKYAKANGLVTVTGNMLTSAASGDTGILFTLPEGFRPSIAIQLPVSDDFSMTIGTNGQATLSGLHSGSVNLTFCATFPVSTGGGGD